MGFGSKFWGTLTLILMVGAVFSQAVGFEYLNLDDNQYVTNNRHVQTGLTWENVRWAFTQSEVGHWHPLTWLSHQLDATWFGAENAAAAHGENVAWHALNTALVFHFLLGLFGWTAGAWWGAAFFGLHPLRIESVAWVTERKDVLSVAFGLMALLGYLAYVRRPTKTRYALVFGCLLMSLLAKPSMVVLPLLCLVLDAAALNRGLGWPRWREKIPLFSLSALGCAVAILSQAKGGGLRGLEEIPFWDRVAGAVVGYAYYFKSFFYPTALSVFYPYRTPSSGETLASLALLAIVSATAWYAYRHGKRYAALGWFWFVIVLLPLSGIVHIGGQAYADRWTYLAHLGFLFIGIAGARDLFPNAIESWPVRAGAMAVLGIFAALTWLDLAHWQNNRTLFTRALELDPTNFMAHTNLGADYDQKGDLAGAAPHYEAAARYRPTYPEALNNLGTLRARQGRLTEAHGLFAEAVRLNPRFVNAQYNLGLSFEMRGQSDKALASWYRALELDPLYPHARVSIEKVARRMQTADPTFSPK